MPYSDAGKNAAVNGIATAGTYISLHTADPGTTGASEVTGGTYARVQTTWATASAGSRAGSQVTLNVPASTTITHWGFWSALTSGTFIYGGTLAANETYGSAGTYQLTPTITVT
jgi:hypothetical protein